MRPLYPNIQVKLVGEDGNAFAIMGRVTKAMRSANVPPEVVAEFREEATSGGYDRLLQTCMKYIQCDDDDEGEAK